MIKKKIFLKKIIFYILIFIVFFIVLPTTITKIKITQIDKKTRYDSFINEILADKKVYSLVDSIKLLGQIEESNKYDIYVESENNKVYKNYVNVNYIFDNTVDIKKLEIKINNDNYEPKENKGTIRINLNNEGKNTLNICVMKNNEEIKEMDENIFYIKPYKSQFADKLSLNGFTTHFAKGGSNAITDENIKLLKASGANIIRDDVSNKYKYNHYDFSESNEWIEKLNNNDIEIIPIFWAPKKVTNEENFQLYMQMITEFAEKYPFIKKYELLNEPNYAYNTDELISWASKIETESSNKLKLINPNVEVLGEGISYTGGGKNVIKLDDYYNGLLKNKEYHKISFFTFHIYDWNRSYGYNADYKWANNNIIEMLKNNGGFYKVSISEFGLNTTSSTREQEAIQDVQQSVINRKNNIYANLIYNFRDVGTDKNNAEHNFGVVDYNWNPKEAYYALKKYYENTNGAEYINTISFANGIEAHLFDKDGKPKIIAWTTTDGNTINIDYSGFTAKDMYGNDIENTNGKLEISNSPVYLDNVSTNYFYQAISNSITSGYYQFKNKFTDEISKVDGLIAKINDLNSQATALKNIDTINESEANELMKEHFELGNMIMSAYEDGKLNIEYVKLSSMLDYSNTIGNSYEDLVTVSAKTRITDLTDITNEVNIAKSLAQDNEKFDIVYPNKIYKFAQDLLDTSSYVLGLEEENDIKTGLINSKALHAKYLAEWSQEFSKIYMKDSLKDSLDKITIANQEIKQNYSNILLNNEIKLNYKNLNNSIKEISDNIEKCNAEKINSIYNEQVDLTKLIVKKYYSNETEIDSNSFNALIKKIIKNLNEYENLFKYYSFEDNISNNDLENTLNTIINRYNDNRDIDFLNENEMINNLVDAYKNINSIEDGTLKYFGKLNIKKTCEIVSNILEGDIKSKAESEYKAISTTADVDLSKPINKDITLTINLPNEKSKITNNNGSNILKFTENGDYIFNINIRGYDYTYKVTVNNIDKTLPEVNIENTGTSLKIETNENLKEIKVDKDGRDLSYKKDDKITKPGIYHIVVTDQAGNQSSSKEIVYGIYKNSNNQEIKYVPIDKTETKAKEIVNDSDFTIKSEKNGTINSNNKEESNDVNVATGDKLIKNGQEYLLVVKGDITKDGEVGVLDLINLRKQLVGLENLKGEQAIAADIDENGKIDVLDLIGERKKIVGIY